MKATPQEAKGLPKRLAAVKKTLRAEYLQKTDSPWVVAYSGGKDSTLLLQLAWEVVEALPPEKRKRRIYVIGNDTLVESPLVISHMKKSLDKIRAGAVSSKMPIETRITKPAIDQTFWVNVIGRGYPPPTRNFRWCTDRMKINPTNNLLKELVRANGEVILLTGTRKSESQNRRRAMEKRGTSATNMSKHSSAEGCLMFAPIADLSDNDVWMTLMQKKTPPWGGTHNQLITLYHNAGGGECPLVLTKKDTPSCGTSSPRFGCWTCTVVPKDKSLSGLINSGYGDTESFEELAEFRNWLLKLRVDNKNRIPMRRDGGIRFKADGSLIHGPFTLEARKKILKRLQKIEKQTGNTFISDGEMAVIQDIWRCDKIRYETLNILLEAAA